MPRAAQNHRKGDSSHRQRGPTTVCVPCPGSALWPVPAPFVETAPPAGVLPSRLSKLLRRGDAGTGGGLARPAPGVSARESMRGLGEGRRDAHTGPWAPALDVTDG